MTRTNKYKTFSRISEAKFRQLLKLFCLDLTAVQITELTSLNRNTVNRYLKYFRERIAWLCEPVKWKLTNPGLEHVGSKVSEAVVLSVKQLSSASSNATAACIPRLSQIVKERH